MAYTTKALVKTYLGITSTGDDTLIDALLAAAQKAIDTYTQRTFEATGDTTRYYTVGHDTVGRLLYLDHEICSITSVKTDADATTPTSLTENTDYIGLPRNESQFNRLEILSSSTYTWTYTDDPEFGVEVAGKFAYSTTAPDDIAQACKRLTAYYYRQKDSQVFDVTAIPEAGVISVPVGIPADVKKTLDLYRTKVYI